MEKFDGMDCWEQVTVSYSYGNLDEDRNLCNSCLKLVNSRACFVLH